MAKKTCECCKTTVGMFQQIKLKDGNYLCRNCTNLTHPLFEPADKRTYKQFQEHLKQIETGKVLYENLFIPRKKPADKAIKLKSFGGGNIEVAKDIGLVALTSKRGGFLFWGGVNFHIVFRLGDLYKYEYYYEIQNSRGNVDQTRTEYIDLRFWDTEGADRFKIRVMRESDVYEAAKFFDDCFGLKKDYSISNMWKNSVADLKKGVQQIKSAFTGKAVEEIDENDPKNLSTEERYKIYGDRTQWLVKADKAINSVLNK